MLDQIFGRLFSSQWIVFLTLVILLVGISEFARRMGLASNRKKSNTDKDSATVRSAVLALLGLLLGFSFAIAGARHEARRELLVEEANSVVTTARRAQLLPEPHAANVVQLLREYVPIRIEAHREGQFSDQFATTRKRSAELQDHMWAEARCRCGRATISDHRQFHRQPQRNVWPRSDAHRSQAQPRARRCLAAFVMRGRLWPVARQLSGGNFRPSLDS
jgi:hypothetical protein